MDLVLTATPELLSLTQLELKTTNTGCLEKLVKVNTASGERSLDCASYQRRNISQVLKSVPPGQCFSSDNLRSPDRFLRQQHPPCLVEWPFSVGKPILPYASYPKLTKS